MSRLERIFIQQEQGGQTTVWADVYGEWAAHDAIGADRHGAVVTHVPSGQKLPSLLTSVSAAREIAQILDAIGLRPPTTEEHVGQFESVISTVFWEPWQFPRSAR